MNCPRILGIGTANPPIRLTQEQSFHAAGYETERMRKISANSDVEYRHFYFGGTPNLQEKSDQQNQRYHQLRFSRTVLRNYGNMASPTVMFVLDQAVRMVIHAPETGE
jgi:Chalcone and stilbene synthases, C-terminal domain